LDGQRRYVRQIPVTCAVVLVVVCSLPVARWLWEATVGFSRTGSSARIADVPLVGKHIDRFATDGSVQYHLEQHPHGTVFAILAGTTTFEEIDQLVDHEEMTRMSSENRGGDKQALIEILNLDGTRCQFTRPRGFSLDSIVYYGRLENGATVTAAFQPDNGAFLMSVSVESPK